MQVYLTDVCGQYCFQFSLHLSVFTLLAIYFKITNVTYTTKSLQVQMSDAMYWML